MTKNLAFSSFNLRGFVSLIFVFSCTTQLTLAEANTLAARSSHQGSSQINPGTAAATPSGTTGSRSASSGRSSASSADANSTDKTDLAVSAGGSIGGSSSVPVATTPVTGTCSNTTNTGVLPLGYLIDSSSKPNCVTQHYDPAAKQIWTFVPKNVTLASLINSKTRLFTDQLPSNWKVIKKVAVDSDNYNQNELMAAYSLAVHYAKFAVEDWSKTPYRKATSDIPDSDVEMLKKFDNKIKTGQVNLDNVQQYIDQAMSRAQDGNHLNVGDRLMSAWNLIDTDIPKLLNTFQAQQIAFRKVIHNGINDAGTSYLERQANAILSTPIGATFSYFSMRPPQILVRFLSWIGLGAKAALLGSSSFSYVWMVKPWLVTVTEVSPKNGKAQEISLTYFEKTDFIMLNVDANHKIVQYDGHMRYGWGVILGPVPDVNNFGGWFFGGSVQTHIMDLRNAYNWGLSLLTRPQAASQPAAQPASQPIVAAQSPAGAATAVPSPGAAGASPLPPAALAANPVQINQTIPGNVPADSIRQDLNYLSKSISKFESLNLEAQSKIMDLQNWIGALIAIDPKYFWNVGVEARAGRFVNGSETANYYGMLGFQHGAGEGAEAHFNGGYMFPVKSLTKFIFANATNNYEDISALLTEALANAGP